MFFIIHQIPASQAVPCQYKNEDWTKTKLNMAMKIQFYGHIIVHRCSAASCIVARVKKKLLV